MLLTLPGIVTGIQLPGGRCECCGGNLVFRREIRQVIVRSCLQCGKSYGEWPVPMVTGQLKGDTTLPQRIQMALILIDLGHDPKQLTKQLKIPRKLAREYLAPETGPPATAQAKRKHLAPVEEDEAIRRLDQGASPSQLAQEFDCTQAAVRRLFPRTRTRQLKSCGLTPEQIQTIREQRALGARVVDLADQFQVAKNVIRYYSTGHRENPIDDTLVQRANQLLAEGMPASEVARRLQFPRQYIYKFCDWRNTAA